MPRQLTTLQEIQSLSANQEAIQPLTRSTFYDNDLVSYATTAMNFNTISLDTSNTQETSSNYFDDNYSYNNIHYYQNNTITFFNNTGDWVMKIQDNNILFNTECLTINEITKIFLQRLEQLTHKEGLQYTFNF